jgi:pyruvate formate lyase activating enzyme
MRIGGIQWMSLIDYPDRIAATLFTAGCNLRCPFCHNPELVLPSFVAETGTTLDESFFDELKERRGFLDGVVISGGEPTVQPDLVTVMQRIKELGYLVKLDTNGTRPDLIQEILETGLADYIAMDIKGSLDAYETMSGVSVDLATIQRSVTLIRRVAPQYEFRTTVAPGLSVANLLSIGSWLEGSRAYWLQLFRAPSEKRLVDEDYREAAALERNDLEAVWQQLRDRFDSGGVRG